MPESPSEGSRRAPIILIGEAYGRWEDIYQRPFVGPSYTDKLLPWWNDARLSRSDFFITNVWDQGQPARIDGISERDMRAAMDRGHDRIAAHEGPDGNGPMVIVPTGNYALYMLTGKGRVSFHMRDGKWLRPGITEFRGSILEYEDRRGRRIKVIPTIHPAACFRTPGYEWVCQRDWQRIAEDARFRELRLPQRTRMIAPTKAEALEYISWTRGEAAKAGERLLLSLDVETPKKVEYETRQKESAAANGKCRGCGHTKRWHQGPSPTTDCRGIRGKGGCACVGFQPLLSKPKKVKISEEAYLGCIGYSWDPKLALCIPTTLAYWQDPAVWAQVKAAMAGLHADPNVDIFGQNFSFDAWWCAEEGMPIHHLPYDLMKMHRVQRPWSEWHDLAFQASLDTREPYWKCLDPDTRVLLSDLTWRRIGNVKVGDELIGIDEVGGRHKRRLRPSTVTDWGVRQASCFEICLSDGRRITASDEHPWLAQRYTTRSNGTLCWIETRDLKPGMRLAQLCPPWDFDESHEGGWLAGIFDGEGSFCQESVFFCQNPGAVLERGKQLLSRKGFRWRRYTKSEVGKVERVGLTSLADTLRFLGTFRPARLLNRCRRVWEGKRGDSYSYKKVDIVSVTPCGVRQVVGLTTSTHTFIAEGFYTHNSEAKDPDSIQRYNQGEALFAYNCTDNCVQRELLPIRLAALRDAGRLDYYLEMEAPIDTELLTLSRHGIRADEPGRAAHYEKVRADAKAVAAEINEHAGRPLVAKVSVSTQKMKAFLYGADGLRLPEQYTKNAKKEKVVSTNVVTIKRLMERFPDMQQLQEVGRRVLRHRRLNTEANFVKAERVDPDGRVRAFFKQDTLLGRLSCSATPKETGTNLQNQDRKLRKFFLPDTGEEKE